MDFHRIMSVGLLAALLMAACSPRSDGSNADKPDASAGKAEAPATTDATGPATQPEPPPAPPADSLEMADGQAIAEMQCGACHATGRDDDSPRTDAPPLRTVLSRLSGDALATDLVEGIKLGHEDMPAFAFNPKAADALLAYLKSIQAPGEAPQ